MKKFAFALLIMALCALPAAAANLLTNGDFNEGLTDWNVFGAAGIYDTGDIGMPASPSGGPFAGVISSWGGDWAGPLGSLSQTFDFTGPGTLSGELFAASHAVDSWRNAGVQVFFNDSVVASLFRDGDSSKYAGDYSWTDFSVPVTGTGNNTLRLDFTVHFAEWTWVDADNLQFNTSQAVPEPSTMLLFGSGMAFAIGWRKLRGAKK